MEIILLIFSTLLDGLVGEHFNAEMRMLNGTPTKLGQFPFAANILHIKGRTRCSASLISSKHCLTAAHCYGSFQESDKMGRCMVGDVNFQPGKPQAKSRQFRNIINFILHPAFVSGNRAENDIAVTTVDKPFEMGVNVAAIPLASKSVKEGSSVVSLGFGLQTRENDSSTVPIETDLAWHYYNAEGDWCKNKPKVICIQYPRRAPYYGDSGGPLITKVHPHELLGVQSRIVSSSNPPHTTIYISVPHKRDWILKQINPEKELTRSGSIITFTLN